MKKFYIILVLVTPFFGLSQYPWVKGGNSISGGSQTTCGTNSGWNAPFQLITQGQIRMHINQSNVFNYGVNTGGFIGIGTNSPASPLHIEGAASQASVGWRRGITLSNNATLVWDGNGSKGFFMAHPSSNPNGNFYAGVLNNLNANSGVNYAFSVHVNQLLGANPEGTTQFYKNVLILENTSATERRLGVNLQDPQRVADFYDGGGNNTTDAQLRLSTLNNNWADLRATQGGNLLLNPKTKRVGINLTTEPTATLDVNGDMRIRNVQSIIQPAVLLVGEANATGDYNVRHLVFSGNAGQVLLGNGTWGTAPSPVTVSAANAAWMNPQGDVEWGTNPLTHDTKIPMANKNVLFQTFNSTSSSITVGGANYSTDARMEINNDYHVKGLEVNGITPTMVGLKFGMYSIVDHASRLTSIFGNARDGDQVQAIYGFGREGLYSTIGVKGYALSGSIQSQIIGGDFTARGGSYVENIGVKGYAEGNLKYNYGGKFKASADQYATVIGVYGEAVSSDTLSATWGGYFVGGLVSTGPTLWPSDSTLKENIVPMDVAFDSLLMQLSPVTYDYKQTGEAGRLQLPKGIRFGVLAQQVEPFFPSVIKEVTHPAEYDTLGVEIAPSFTYKAVDMTQLIPIMLFDLKKKSEVANTQAQLIEAQNQTINDLNNRLTTLENCLSGILPFLCQLSNSAIQPTQESVQEQLRNAIDVQLSDRNNIILNQNVPNPFAERTVISYSIPESVKKAHIHFYNGQGALINSVDIVERGVGEINVYSNDLSSGVYTYSLVADGVIIATKRMVKE